MSLKLYNKKDIDKIIELKDINECNEIDLEINYKINDIINLLKDNLTIQNLMLNIKNINKFNDFLKENKTIKNICLLNKCKLKLEFIKKNKNIQNIEIINYKEQKNNCYKIYNYDFKLLNNNFDIDYSKFKLILLNFNKFELINFNHNINNLRLINNYDNYYPDINNSYIINITDDYIFFKRSFTNIKFKIINNSNNKRNNINNIIKKNDTIKDIIIINDKIDNFDFLKNNETITKLDLSYFKFERNNLFEKLCETLKINQTIYNLNLSNCNLNSKNIEILFDILTNYNSSIAELNLSNNKIQHLKNINNLLKNNILTELNLSFNPFIKITELCEGLKNNISLIDLNIEKERDDYTNFKLNNKDLQKLYDTLKYNSSLTKLNLKGIYNISIDIFNMLKYNSSLCELSINILNDYYYSKDFKNVMYKIFDILKNNTSLISLEININENNYKSFFDFLKTNNNIYKIKIYYDRFLKEDIIKNQLEEVLKTNIFLYDIDYQVFI